MNRGLLHLLLCLVLAFMGTPAWAHCRPETRVGGSPVFSSDFASLETANPIGTPTENGGCGYDFASGVHKYLYAEANPVNGIDPSGSKLVKCSVDAETGVIWVVGGKHVYLWNDVAQEAYTMDGSADSNPFDNQFDQVMGSIKFGASLAPGSEGVKFADVPGSAGKEQAVKSSVQNYPHGKWVLGYNDCETLVKTVLKENNLTNPKIDGRFDFSETRSRLRSVFAAVWNFSLDDDSDYY